MLSRMATLLRCSRTGATEITFHAAIRGDAFPDPSEFDLVILTGGPFNLLKHTEENERPEWVRRTLGWIQETVKFHEASGLSEPGSKKKSKLLGICWGHQAIALALGGRLGQVPQERGGQLIGVETVPLTSQGAAFFKSESLVWTYLPIASPIFLQTNGKTNMCFYLYYRTFKRITPLL